MSQFLSDEEDYYFQIAEELEDDKQFILIIYDITDNRRRLKFAKLLEGYGKRVQKSAFILIIKKERTMCVFIALPEKEKLQHGEKYRIL